MEESAPEESGNRLLDRLPPEARAALVEGSRVEYLPQRRTLWEPGVPVEHVYFPLRGVMSLLAVTREGASVEVATVGTEGMVGVAVFLGQRRAVGRAMSQIPGDGVLIDGDRFEAVVRASPKVRELLNGYTHAVLIHITQGAICNRLHSVEQRLARWVLEMVDRIRPEQLPVTHEFLAQMLGVRRASVTDAVAPLQSAGAIAHERGRIQVLDHDLLTGLSCECYDVVRKAYDELLDWATP